MRAPAVQFLTWSPGAPARTIDPACCAQSGFTPKAPTALTPLLPCAIVTASRIANYRPAAALGAAAPRGVFTVLDARRALVVIAAILAAATVATAGTLTVQGAGGVSLDITCDVPPSESATPELSGLVSIAPVSEQLRQEPMVLYVDGVVRGLTSEAGGRFHLDATALGEGEHALRVDALRGEQLLASTGGISVTVLSAAEAATRQIPPPTLGDARPAFVKLYRPRVFREIVYFNNREGDLEKHAFVRNGRVYITLTDLMRHIGGTIIWGPDDDDLEVERNGITVRLFPSSRTVYVNGVAQALDRTTLRRQNRTYVPVRPFAALFGIVTEWDFQDDRAYVTYQE